MFRHLIPAATALPTCYSIYQRVEIILKLNFDKIKKKVRKNIFLISR